MHSIAGLWRSKDEFHPVRSLLPCGVRDQTQLLYFVASTFNPWSHFVFPDFDSFFKSHEIMLQFIVAP